MATITAYQASNLYKPNSWEGDVTSADAHHFTLEDGTGNSNIYYGSLTYAAYGLTGETITGFESYHNGTLQLELKNGSFEAVKTAAYILEGNISDLMAYLLSGNDTIYGSIANDVITAGRGINFIDGGQGLDTFVLNANCSESKISSTLGSTILISNNIATDSLVNIERLQFQDKCFANDVNANNAAKVISAAFGTSYISKYLAAGITFADSGMDIDALCKFIDNNKLVESISGSSDNQSYVKTLFTNVFGHSPNSDELNTYTAALDSGAYTNLSLLEAAAHYSLTASNVDSLKIDLIGIPYNP